MYRTDHSLAFMPSTARSVQTKRPAVQQGKALQTSRCDVTPVDVVRLAAEEMSVMRTKRRVTITCDTGVLWVTEDWNPTDTLLRPGESFVSTNAGRIVIQAFAPSSYRTNVVRAAWWSRPWQGVADRMSLAIRISRARSLALQSDRRIGFRRTPLPDC